MVEMGVGVKVRVGVQMWLGVGREWEGQLVGRAKTASHRQLLVFKDQRLLMRRLIQRFTESYVMLQIHRDLLPKIQSSFIYEATCEPALKFILDKVAASWVSLPLLSLGPVAETWTRYMNALCVVRPGRKQVSGRLSTAPLQDCIVCSCSAAAYHVLGAGTKLPRTPTHLPPSTKVKLDETCCLVELHAN